MSHHARRTRRAFLGTLAGSAALALAGNTTVLSRPAASAAAPARRRQRSANDQIQVALIGAGGMGVEDAKTALTIDGVRLVAVCDLYDGRLNAARELWGQDLVATRDYREVLDRPDVDAVIIATPDHWHMRISMDALDKGKSVYCEKPMVRDLSEGEAVIAAERRSKAIFQVGSQGLSSLGNEKAKELLAGGAIGTLNYAEGFWARNSPVGAWQYAVPKDASEQTVDWNRFLGSGPKRPFDPIRFFRWRNYRDYGTGVSGDLFVHLFSSLHFITGSVGPTTIMASGGLRYWKDGRDAPDIMLGMFDYPETSAHPPFNLSLRVNFVDGTSGSTYLRLVGSDGAMDVTWDDVTVRRNKRWDPLRAVQKEFMHDPEPEGRKEMLPASAMVYKVEQGYKGAHYDHFSNFFAAIRGGRPVVEEAVFGFRAAAPALACNQSYYEKRAIYWDPVAMKVTGVGK
jgi:predicted dehydrogenase